MLDTKKVGIKILSLRKGRGYSQEKLADMLNVSSQAISKWENGHTLPDTALLPVIAQIFGCSIDDIIMPAYAFDEKIEEQKLTEVNYQAEQIAKHVIKKLEGKMAIKDKIGLNDDTIIEAVCGTHGNMGVCTVNRGSVNKIEGNTVTSIALSAPQREINLIEKIYGRNDAELYRCNFLSPYINVIPHIYHIDYEKKIILREDLGDYIKGYNFVASNVFGDVIRENYSTILKAAAKWHSVFWENGKAFEQLGLDWRLESKENLLAHISAMEKDFKKYKKNEETEKIPKVSGDFENNLELEKLVYFEDAIRRLKEEYIELVESRFHTGKNITVIHGDMHPGATNLSKSAERTVKFDGLQAVRMGLCTEDLAMFIALHIEPDKKRAQPLLDYYYGCLCENVKNYPYDVFINDYKIAIMENMFFAIRLINCGIFDFKMRDKAIKAYETFIN